MKKLFVLFAMFVILAGSVSMTGCGSKAKDTGGKATPSSPGK